MEKEHDTQKRVVPWVNDKQIEHEHVKGFLDGSAALHQFTNYGPVVRQLEEYFKRVLGVSDEKCVIATVSAAVGLSVLVYAINLENEKALVYAVQDFTFPCNAQGPLQNAKVVDIDESTMNFDLEKLDPELIDGIIVTNLFGNVCDIEKYIDWSTKHNKVLLFDNATVPFTIYKGQPSVNYGTGCIISLHHTKPIGFGEGGLVIVDKKYEPATRKLINFGFEISNGEMKWHPFGCNGKMSDVSAAFILSFNTINQDKIVEHHKAMYQNLKSKLQMYIDNGILEMFPNYGDGIPFVSCFPIVFKKIMVEDSNLNTFESLGVVAKKYYKPLTRLPNSQSVYQRILCLPCHIDVTEEDLETYVELIKKVFNIS